MHKLTIDPSTQMGWCLLLSDEGKPENERRTLGQRLSYGTWDLTRDLNNQKCNKRGQYYINFLECFRQLRNHHGIDDDQIKIVLEGEAYSAERTEASARLAAGWIAVLEMYCERKGNPYPITATTDEWRHSFVGFSRTPAEVGKGLEKKERTKIRSEWMKNKVLELCKARGLIPKTDNESDALGLMFWLLNGGEEAQRVRRETNKAKKQAKRQQTKMNLKVAA